MKKVLITAGATREPIDAVRHISNMATGALGVEIAKEACTRNYDVHLLYGFGTADIPEHIRTTRFTTTQNLLEKVLENIKDADIYISSAAVSDYAPIPVDKKISSEQDELVIRLSPTPKVLKQAKLNSRPETLFVAFKLGYNLSEDELINQAVKSYGEIGDVIVANDLAKIDESKHEALVLYKNTVFARAGTKQEIAKLIFDCIEKNNLF